MNSYAWVIIPVIISPQLTAAEAKMVSEQRHWVTTYCNVRFSLVK